MQERLLPAKKCARDCVAFVGAAEPQHTTVHLELSMGRPPTFFAHLKDYDGIHQPVLLELDDRA